MRGAYVPGVKSYGYGFILAFVLHRSNAEAVTIAQSPVRIAMWSGPRNISTAMMRSWENRADTAVVDEPFYAYYLKATSKKHPGSPEIMAQSETDVQRVIHNLIGPVPESRKVYYQKHMTHHLLPEIDRVWLGKVTNCFLIRDPAQVIISYLKKKDEAVTLEDLGFVQQLDIFDWVRARTGSVPAVIDAQDVLQDPERSLRLLCSAVKVEFDPAMLSWPPGLRKTDGIWAKYWYEEVARSTGFQRYRETKAEVPPDFRDIHARCRECYERLYQYRLI